MELEGRQEIVTQHGKALREYKCPNCGGSVDILGGGVCDYCNAAVDYRNFGWIITSYTNLGQPENPYAKILAAALGIYGIILAFSLVLMIYSRGWKRNPGDLAEHRQVIGIPGSREAGYCISG